ncbi:MAG: hypothetical protein BWY06_02302 [Candidatus Latescibacteria bacterium ADurb.Bin168]|nr:MAG: hypothetical protein BWY06_02302 [Candidatus Latescibacteria bacterium ADurb.Bin168]
MLPSCAGRAIRIHSNIGFLHIQLDFVVEFWIHEHTGE